MLSLLLSWLRREWIVREGNQAADVGLHQSSKFTSWEEPPEAMSLILFKDAIGVELPRGF